MLHLRFAFATLLLTGPVALAAAQPAQPTQQDEFVPISQLPPQEQLPAAPLLVGAYVFVVVTLFVYVLSVARRVTTVQREVDSLAAEIKGRKKG